MTKPVLNIFSIIAFVLIPVIAVINPSDLKVVMIIAYGIYCLFVCILHFIHTFNSWKENNLVWKKEAKLSYLFTILLILSASAIFLKWNSRIIESFLIYYFYPFIFFVGITLLILGFIGLKYRKSSPSSYLTINFVAGTIFTLVGIHAILFWVLLFSGLLFFG
jgi:hypothetical protein